jgi:hypothetical protein
VVRNTKIIVADTVFDRRPVEPVKGVVIGGIPASKKGKLPQISVSGTSKVKVEIQVAEDLPTSLTVTKLRPRATASVSIIGANGREIVLGQFRVDNQGELELPPITLTQGQSSVRVRVTVAGVTRTITIRA